MVGMRFIMNAGRTSKQGQQINVGKDNDEYNAIVNTLTLHPEDLKALGVVLLSRIVARLISMAVMIHIRLPLINVTSLASMATSVPVPMAKPTSACAKKHTN